MRGQFGGQQARFAGAARMQVFAHRAGLHELPQAAGLGAGVAERIQGLFVGQFEQAGRRHRRAEGSTGRGVVPDTIMRRSHGSADTTHGFETVQYCAQHLFTAGAGFFAEGEYRRHHDASRVSYRGAMQIVGLGNVRQCAHQQRLAFEVEITVSSPAT
jgi:hypothetical protein